MAIPQIPKGWQVLPFRLFLASALRGLYSIYAIYRGVGVGVGVVFGVVLGFGDGVCLQRLLRLENSIQCFRALHNSWVILSLVRLNKSHRRVYPALVASPNSPDRWRTGSGFRFGLPLEIKLAASPRPPFIRRNYEPYRATDSTQRDRRIFIREPVEIP